MTSIKGVSTTNELSFINRTSDKSGFNSNEKVKSGSFEISSNAQSGKSRTVKDVKTFKTDADKTYVFTPRKQYVGIESNGILRQALLTTDKNGRYFYLDSKNNKIPLYKFKSENDRATFTAATKELKMLLLTSTGSNFLSTSTKRKYEFLGNASVIINGTSYELKVGRRSDNKFYFQDSTGKIGLLTGARSRTMAMTIAKEMIHNNGQPGAETLELITASIPSKTKKV